MYVCVCVCNVISSHINRSRGYYDNRILANNHSVYTVYTEGVPSWWTIVVIILYGAYIYIATGDRSRVVIDTYVAERYSPSSNGRNTGGRNSRALWPDYVHRRPYDVLRTTEYAGCWRRSPSSVDNDDGVVDGTFSKKRSVQIHKLSANFARRQTENEIELLVSDEYPNTVFFRSRYSRYYSLAPVR